VFAHTLEVICNILRSQSYYGCLSKRLISIKPFLYLLEKGSGLSTIAYRSQSASLVVVS
jgi:hypothetical protein